MLMMSVATFAQDKAMSKNAQRAHQTVSKWEQPLNLTVDQKKQAKQIMLDKFDRHDKVKAQFEADKNETAKKDAVAKIKADTKADMKAILTTDQYTKWEKLYDKQTGDK